VTSARAAHAAATTNANAAKERATRAEAAHRQAIADQQGVIDRAAAGAPVEQADVACAATAVAEAKDAADHAALVALGAVSLLESPKVDLLRAQAAHAIAAHADALDRLIARAADIDEALNRGLQLGFNTLEQARTLRNNKLPQTIGKIRTNPTVFG
jgi:hypothetical protein